MATQALQNLYVGVLLSLMIVVVSRNFRISVYFYVVHAVLLSLIFAWYAYYMGNPLFYVWAATTFLTRVILVPFAKGGLLYTIKKFLPKETKPIVPLGPSLLFISALMVTTWTVFHSYIDLIAPIPEATVEPSRTNLAIAFTIFTLGLYTILTRRDVIKTVLGLAMMENGIHLTLVDLTPTMSEAVVLGMLTNVVVTIFILLYLSRLIYIQLGIRDTVELSELRY